VEGESTRSCEAWAEAWTHSDRQKKLLVLPCGFNVKEKNLYTSYKKLNLSSLKSSHN